MESQNHIFHVYPKQNLLSTQQKRRNLFRRFRDAFINCQHNGVVTLKHEFVDLDRKISDNNFEVDGWGFRAFWHGVGLTESEMEFFFQECAAISAAQLEDNQQVLSDIETGGVTSQSNSISVDLAESAVYVRRSFDCRRQQLHDILKRIRVKKLHPKHCPFAQNGNNNKKKQNCSRLVVFDYLTRQGDLSHSEAFLLMDACSVPKKSAFGNDKRSENPNHKSSDHNIGLGKYQLDSSAFHQPSLPTSNQTTSVPDPTSPVNQTNTQDSEIDLALLTSCIFVFPLPDSVAFSLLLGKIVDSLCDSFRGSGPTGVTAIVHACAKLITRSSHEELESWLRDQNSLSRTQKLSESFDVRLDVEEFVNVCSNAIAAGMPRAEVVLLHSFLSDEEDREKFADLNRNFDDDDENEDGDSPSPQHQRNTKSNGEPTLSLRKFVTAVNDRIPLLSENAFNTSIAEVRHHILATRAGFSGLFHHLVKCARQTGQVLDRAGVISALRAINVSPVFVPDITIERAVSYFLVHHNAYLGQGPSLQTVRDDFITKRHHHRGSGGGSGHSHHRHHNDSASVVTMFIRSFIEVLRGKVSLNRMEIVEKLYHRLTDGVLVPQIKMLSSVPTSYTTSHLTDNFETTRENRRRALASLLDEDEFEIVMGEIDREELAKRRQIREAALYQKLLKASDFLLCFAPDLVHGGGGSQQNKLQKTATRCQQDLIAYLKTLDRLSYAVGDLDNENDNESDDDYYYGDEGNFRTSSFPNDSPLSLSLAEFGFFWANFAMTIADDSEFTIMLWEGFSMHKALSSTNDQKAFKNNKNSNNNKNNNANSSSSSHVTTPRNHIHRRNLGRGEDVGNYLEQQRQNQQQHHQREPSSPPAQGIAALIAASHEEERKRRQHVEKLASAAWSKVPESKKITDVDVSSSSIGSTSIIRQNNTTTTRASSAAVTPRYHHHYHHPHPHEELVNSPNHRHVLRFSDDNNNNHNENDNDASTMALQRRSSQRAREIYDRSQDVVAEFEKREKEKQDKYRHWEESSQSSSSFRPQDNDNNSRNNNNHHHQNQNRNNNNNITGTAGRKVVSTSDTLGKTRVNIVPASSVTVAQQSNHNNNNDHIQEDSSSIDYHNYHEGDIVGYTDDGKPIVLQRVIMPNDDDQNDENEEEDFASNDDVYDDEEYNQDHINDNDDQQQDQDESNNNNNNTNNTRTTVVRPELAEAIPLIMNNNNHPSSSRIRRVDPNNNNSSFFNNYQQQQDNNNSHNNQPPIVVNKRKRVQTALEIYEAGEEKLMRDISAYHHRPVPNKNRDDDDDVEDENTYNNNNHHSASSSRSSPIQTDNVVLRSKNNSTSRHSSSQRNQQYQQHSSSSRNTTNHQNIKGDAGTRTPGKTFQGFLPSFGVPGLGWNGIPKRGDSEDNNDNDHNEENNTDFFSHHRQNQKRNVSNRRPHSAAPSSASEAARRNLRTSNEIAEANEKKTRVVLSEAKQRRLEEQKEKYFEEQREKHDHLHPSFSRKKFIKGQETRAAREMRTEDY